MTRIRIIPSQQEVVMNGIRIPFASIKKHTYKIVSADKDYDDLVVAKRFDRTTGDVIKRYAWDSVIFRMKEKGILKEVFRSIVEEEGFFHDDLE